MAAKGFIESITPIQQNDNESKYLEEIVKEIYSTKDIEVKTDLSQEQVNAVAKMVSFSEHFNVPILEKFANNYMKLMISKDRKGRGEFTQIATSANSSMTMEEPSVLAKLGGIK